MKITIKELADIIESRYGDPARFISSVRVWLHEHQISQMELAARAGLDASNLNRWLNNRVYPSLKNMLIIDEALEQLIGAEDQNIEH